MHLLELQGTYREVQAAAGPAHRVCISSAPEPSTLKTLPPAEVSFGFFLTSHQITQSAKNVGRGQGKMGGLHPPCLHPPSLLPLKSTLLLCISALHHG